jgi:hypothetical protein
VQADGLPLVGFAAAVLAFDALLWTYDPSLLAGLLLTTPAAAAVVAAVAIAGRRRQCDATRIVPELSLATAVCAAALALIALAAIFGLWLLLIGLGLGALGGAGLVRELVASARARR